MHSGILFIGVLSVICWGVQLLPVISVPITGRGTNYSLCLSHYNNVSFGVFGVCDTVRHICSPAHIGYTDAASFIYASDADTDESDGTLTVVQLPSEVTHVVSKLLVVHVIAFVFTSFLVLQSMFMFLVDLLELNDSVKAFIEKSWIKLHKLRSKSKSNIQCPITRAKMRKINYQYLNVMLCFAIFSFLSNLLAFLADFLLFVPKLGPLGWIQQLPVLIMALIASLLCFLKRSIQSRRHLNEDNESRSILYQKRGTLVDDTADSLSDDGIFIYSNGFLSSHKDGMLNSLQQQGGASRVGSPDIELQSFDSR